MKYIIKLLPLLPTIIALMYAVWIGHWSTVIFLGVLGLQVGLFYDSK